MRPHASALLGSILLCATPSLAASGGQPLTVSQSGFLLDAADQPLDASALTMSFRIFDRSASTAGETLEWQATCAVAVRKGLYAVVLGEGACAGTETLDTADLPLTSARWIEIAIGSITLAPRLAVTTVPHAALAGQSLDAQSLITTLASAGQLNHASNPVDWSRLKNVPSGFADGTDDGSTYAAAPGGGLALSGSNFSIAANGVTSGMLAADPDALGKLTGSAFTQSASGGNFAIGTAAGTERFVVRRTDTGPIASFLGENHSAGDPATRVRIQDLTGGVAWFLSANDAGEFAVHQGAAGDRMTFATNGNVGIGAGAPGQKLTVAGTIESTSGGFMFPDGTVQSTAATGAGGGGGGYAWQTISTNVTATANTAYLANAATRLTVTLPATCAVGDRVRVVGINSGGWTLAVPAGASFLDVSAATGSESVTSSTAGEELEVTCVVANTRWKLSEATNASLLRVVAYPSAKTTLTMQGADQTYWVPAGVTKLRLKLWGAGGAGQDPSVSRGGAGAYVFQELWVNPGEPLTVVVGQGGRPGSNYGWGGGGYSAVKRGSTILALAAGGGGSAWSHGGYGGCATGGNGGGPNPGGGATQTAGGTAGGGGNAQPGSFLQGGDGMTGSSETSPRAYGGGGVGYWQNGIRQTAGGGGGYFGGGGSGERSSNDSSAGGGSSWWSSSGSCTAGGAAGAAPNTGDSDYASGIAVGGGSTTNTSSYPGGNGRVVIY